MAKLSARQQHEEGWRRASRSFAKELLAASRGVTRDAQQVMVNTTEDFLGYVQDKKENLPYYTANLHDSIAAAVYKDGHVIRAKYMPKEATRPQTAAGRKRIVGEEEAFRAVRSFRPASRGVTGTLFVAVPYAEGADKESHHPGYLEWLEENFTISMDSALGVLRMSNGKDALANYGRFKSALKGNL